MGNTSSVIKKVNFEDIQLCIKKKDKFLLINTLSKKEQKCLIMGTLKIEDEEKIINQCINQNKHVKIVVYDKNVHETSLLKKYEQLNNLGFTNVFIYPGGLFEWLCLQDIYGYEEFPTTTKELDILKFKGPSSFTNILLLEN
tara:strand:+ start:411 stop:836 length:426 start_codon:yes stop_codon:yes gene_type:complete